MESKGKLLCGVVAILGLISAGTGFGAEVKRVKASQVTLDISGQCLYPRSPALVLALTAAASLLIAKIIISFSTGCFCCKRTGQTPNSNRGMARTFFVFSWITFVIAFGMLLSGAALSERHGESTVKYGNYYCYVVKPGVFAGGAFLAAVSAIFGILYYQTLNSTEKNTAGTGFPGSAASPNQGGIAMAKPQFPTQGNAAFPNHGGLAMA